MNTPPYPPPPPVEIRCRRCLGFGDHWLFWKCKQCGGLGTVPPPPRPAPPKPFPPSALRGRLKPPDITIEICGDQYEALLQAIGAFPATDDVADLLESCRDWIRNTEVVGETTFHAHHRADQALLLAMLEQELRERRKP